MHHVVAAGWSVGILVRELLTADAHHGDRSGDPDGTDRCRPAGIVAPEAPEYQYADFCDWQEEWLRGPAAQRRLAYWEKQLDGELPDAPLPRDGRLAAGAARGAAALHSFEVQAPVLARMERLCRDAHSTPYTLMLAAFQIVLGRYTGTDDVLVGTPCSTPRTTRTCSSNASSTGSPADAPARTPPPSRSCSACTTRTA